MREIYCERANGSTGSLSLLCVLSTDVWTGRDEGRLCCRRSAVCKEKLVEKVTFLTKIALCRGGWGAQ